MGGGRREFLGGFLGAQSSFKRGQELFTNLVGDGRLVARKLWNVSCYAWCSVWLFKRDDIAQYESIDIPLWCRVDS